MSKAKITTLAGMSEEQILEDLSMSPLERINLAFQISDFAKELRPELETIEDKSSSIEWIELHRYHPEQWWKKPWSQFVPY